MKSLEKEFDRQAENLLVVGYPGIAGMQPEAFVRLLNPLKKHIRKLEVWESDMGLGHISFVIVVKNDVISAEKAMSFVAYNGKPGVTKLYPHTPESFMPVESICIPDGTAYIITGIDRGKGTLNVKPAEAFTVIQGLHRSPLTIDEGIAIVTQFPEFLMKNNCFSLLASRTGSDKRVPAIWINAAKQANLGWCWNGNPHTWLGSASCESRIGIA